MTKRLAIIDKDSWLEPVESEINYRHDLYLNQLYEIEQSAGSLSDFANAHRFFGWQRDEANKGWWFREWLPEAYEVYIFGDFNDWDRNDLPLMKGENGVWSIFLYDGEFHITHGSLYKMLVVGANGTLERLPAYCRRAVQDEVTKDFTAQFWNPADKFDWTGDGFDCAALDSLCIYECHIGMAQEREGIGTYNEFTDNVLPRIKSDGYNTIQIMGIAEHPYYGSYGYHVSNFFAPSSRFGTPEELKRLIRTAHEMNIAVVMDVVHAHYVKNVNEGINELDGSDHCYSPAGDAGYQKYWDSKTFDYGKREVMHFLLSNLKYWIEEFHFDGFRFDGVTSMIYHHHGYTEFDSREKFFDESVNRVALTYLTLANSLVHQIAPSAVTIAEDVSGMPGMCIAIDQGGVGFDYRLAMAIPDFWIKMLKEIPDEQWNIWDIWNIMTNRLPDVGTVAYCESHDQAMVGDKTIAFRLMDKAMYTDMNVESANILIDRGMSLHKMIRLATISLGGQAYLNFMGNEFGHPEWIDFPRLGNDWSYHYARRQWSLADNRLLRYHLLGQFDKAMLNVIMRFGVMRSGYAYNLAMDEQNKIMVFSHDDLLFVFNWNPQRSIPDYIIHTGKAGTYRMILSTDEERFGGQGREDSTVEHFTYARKDDDGQTRNYMKIYTVSRTATVYKRS